MNLSDLANFAQIIAAACVVISLVYRLYVHEATRRTVDYQQPAADGRTHLFAPNGFFVATEELTEGN
jgi:hypothetical protein